MHQYKTWLFTDLDGTLIPLDDNAGNRQDLAALKSFLSTQEIGLAFVTGRHLESALDALNEHDLPEPEWIVCDVGSNIATKTTGNWSPLDDYESHLTSLSNGWSSMRLRALFKGCVPLTPQEPQKQSTHKLSYYTDSNRLGEVTTHVTKTLKEHAAPISVISSVDPFNGDGLIDLLPGSVDKAYAMAWLSDRLSIDYQRAAIFSGDSGNDSAAMLSGCRAILVGNAKRELADSLLAESKSPTQIYLATEPATSGVLEGLHHWILPRSTDPSAS